MALSSFGPCSEVIPKAMSSLKDYSKRSNLSSRLVKIDFATDSSTASTSSKRDRSRKNSKSSHLAGNKIGASRVYERKLVQKKTTDAMSSFPMAINIYKASSDEFKPIKHNKKFKKSVLTLPNKHSALPERCTVSDMTDSEYFTTDDRLPKVQPKRRFSNQNKKNRCKNRDFEFLDGDPQYCSQRNIELNCSSSEMMNHFKGDCKSVSRTMNPFYSRKRQTQGKFDGHKVWQVLRNMNRFQFKSSPPASDDDIDTPRTKRATKRHNRKDARFIETCRTEEFAYFSSIEVDSNSPRSFSQSSSFDRITIIDKQDEFSKLCEKFENAIVKSHGYANDGTAKKCNRRRNNTSIIKTPRIYNKIPELNHRKSKLINNKDLINNNNIEQRNSRTNYTDTSNNIVTGSYNHDSLCENNDSTNLDHKALQPPEPNELQDSFIYPRNSGPSNNLALVSSNKLKGMERPLKLSDENNQQLKGISKVVMKGQDAIAKRAELQKRNQRIVTMMPTSVIFPKLTQTEIKRRIANIKFPLVILGKDEHRSTIQVVNQDHPQFSGLDKHIWPYMVEWSGDVLETEKSNKLQQNMENVAPKVKLDKNKIESRSNSIRRNNNNVVNKIFPSENKSIVEVKQKPIRQKDKILKFLYRKVLPINNYKINSLVEGGDVEIRTSEKVETKKDIDIIPPKRHSPTTKQLSKTPTSSINPQFLKINSSTIKTSQTKTNPFIESVIMNIKNGVYFNDEQGFAKNKLVTMRKDVFVQTLLTSENILRMQSDQEITYQKEAKSNVVSTIYSNVLKGIPGFDYTLPDLEIKTLNMDKIEVKHRLSNVLVQFDITSPKKETKNLIGLKKSPSLMQLELIDSDSKILKCKTAIVNAILPAELCSLLPKIISDLISSDVRLPVPSLPLNKAQYYLSTISELSPYEYTDSVKMPNICIRPSHLECLTDGRFPKTTKYINRKSLHFNVGWIGQNITLDLLLPLSSNVFMCTCDMDLSGIFCSMKPSVNKPTTVEELKLSHKESYCNILQCYNLKTKRLSTTFKPYDFNDMLLKVWMYFTQANAMPTISLTKVTFNNVINLVGIDITMEKEHNDTKAFIDVRNLKINSIYESSPKESESFLSNKSKDTVDIDANKKGSVYRVKSSTSKRRGKCFVKLYKKCKSTSNISTERENLCLNKIETLEDFFQLFGSRKSFSGVFDGYIGQKIMSSIKEMKNWITEINSRQALLILLLVNKKDTQNLVRYRPILLQGIAVNRITRASELDMEIEVIEKENLTSNLQFEGIPYLPTSIENRDNLLEELCWIAKTTASDYQRLFDESSEKLLKSLLEKRKKLNPSYLRVMARYVGLGLLKPLRK